jgi:hypothetical protein
MKKYLTTFILALAASASVFAYQAKADTYGSSLVGYWNLDSNDISGTSVYDLSGNGNTGTTVGSPTETVGRLGQALSFDGATQYVTASGFSPGSLTAITVSAWVKSGSTQGTNAGVAYAGGNTGFALNSATRRLFVYIAGGGGGTSYYATTGVWTLVTLVWDSAVSSVGSIYINGSYLEAGASRINPITPTGFNIGLGTSYFSGSIDDVRVYNRGLSAAEVKTLYYQSLGTHGGFN